MASSSLRTVASTSFWLRRLGSSTANSSCPMRATVALVETMERSFAPTALSTALLAVRPKPESSSPKPSMSSAMTAILRLRPCACSIASSTRRLSCAAFGRPVSLSKFDMRCRRASNFLRAITSLSARRTEGATRASACFARQSAAPDFRHSTATSSVIAPRARGSAALRRSDG